LADKLAARLLNRRDHRQFVRSGIWRKGGGKG
jgi:hypothetical protein